MSPFGRNFADGDRIEIAGAVGVTGATAPDDEFCALAGAKAAKLKAEA